MCSKSLVYNINTDNFKYAVKDLLSFTILRVVTELRSNLLVERTLDASSNISFMIFYIINAENLNGNSSNTDELLTCLEVHFN